MASHAHSSKTNARSEHAVRSPSGAEATNAAPEHLDAEAAARHGHRFEDVPATAPARGASAGGQPLPASIHQEMRRTLGTDFSDVRLHVDSRPSLHRKDALTQGNHIHVSPEAYRPHEPAGRGLLAHELTHVVQQRHGRVAQPSGSGPLNSDSGLEREADAVGMKVAEGGAVPLHGARPSPAAGVAAGPAAAAPIQGGDFFKNLLNKFSSKKNKFQRKQVDALTKFEDLPEDKQGLLEDEQQHDAKRKQKVSNMSRKSVNLVMSGAMKAAQVPGLSNAVKGVKSARNVYNDQKTLNELAISKKFMQGSDDQTLPLNHALSQEDVSEDNAEMIEKVEKVIKGKQMVHAANALPLGLGFLAKKARNKVQKDQIDDAANEVHSGAEANENVALHVRDVIAKNDKSKSNAARNANQIGKLLKGK